MTIIGDFDIAQLVLYAFWAFFFGLIIYIQRETMREGYPLESETTGKPAMFGPWGLPAPKIFRLPHGHGEVMAPNPEKDAREITDRKFALRPTEKWSGAPFEPTGDPMVDGVGPASWAERKDVPEMTLHGDAKIVPLRVSNEWSVAEGDRDIRGWSVTGCDGQSAGVVKDIWVDRSEALIRYIEIELPGGGSVLAPMTGVIVGMDGKTVKVHSITAAQFAKVPALKSPEQITMLEEEKVMAYYAGGKLYANAERAEPWM
ncbi:photosynthetic reaction center subunit H [Rubrimonas cliftonensis]|uniref:Photosynthetic reaction center H subunit n=1 Tax=Rubrimonas cliftonensis TaxID=89524 RepID=A0A1H4AED4_9RHOB|nr:photosynthetic reaction center subunit H [Rubrimonas cliftonensis]SEA33874.1 photosynthetic reaction center H subunit [Rubrimonas cliftonensis]